jgi:hypothetical protein
VRLVGWGGWKGLLEAGRNGQEVWVRKGVSVTATVTGYEGLVD